MSKPAREASLIERMRFRFSRGSADAAKPKPAAAAGDKCAPRHLPAAPPPAGAQPQSLPVVGFVVVSPPYAANANGRDSQAQTRYHNPAQILWQRGALHRIYQGSADRSAQKPPAAAYHNLLPSASCYDDSAATVAGGGGDFLPRRPSLCQLSTSYHFEHRQQQQQQYCERQQSQRQYYEKQQKGEQQYCRDQQQWQYSEQQEQQKQQQLRRHFEQQQQASQRHSEQQRQEQQQQLPQSNNNNSDNCKNSRQIEIEQLYSVPYKRQQQQKSNNSHFIHYDSVATVTRGDSPLGTSSPIHLTVASTEDTVKRNSSVISIPIRVEQQKQGQQQHCDSSYGGQPRAQKIGQDQSIQYSYASSERDGLLGGPVTVTSPKDSEAPVYAIPARKVEAKNSFRIVRSDSARDLKPRADNNPGNPGQGPHDDRESKPQVLSCNNGRDLSLSQQIPKNSSHPTSWSPTIQANSKAVQNPHLQANGDPNGCDPKPEESRHLSRRISKNPEPQDPKILEPQEDRSKQTVLPAEISKNSSPQLVEEPPLSAAGLSGSDQDPAGPTGPHRDLIETPKMARSSESAHRALRSSFGVSFAAGEPSTTIVDYSGTASNNTVPTQPQESSSNEIFIFNAKSNVQIGRSQPRNDETNSSTSNPDAMNDSGDAMKDKSGKKFNICSVIGRNNKKSTTPDNSQPTDGGNQSTPSRPSNFSRQFEGAQPDNRTSTPNVSVNPIVITPLSPMSPIMAPFTKSPATNDAISDDKSVVLFNRRPVAHDPLFNGVYPTDAAARRRRSSVLENFASPPFGVNVVGSPASGGGVVRSPSMQEAPFLAHNANESSRYLDASTTAAAQIVEAVRRSATVRQELTEPIVVLAKQLANKEMEIERLRSRLNRRSGRAENRCAYYEDELVTARHEVEYTREQMTKLRQKLRQAETECASLREKKDETELKLKTLTASYELKSQTTEQESATQRKEYNRLRELEEAYEKYMDERDWSEKITDTLNGKLDEREREIVGLKAKIAGLTDELAALRNSTPQWIENPLANQRSRKSLKSMKSSQEREISMKQEDGFRKMRTASRSSNDERGGDGAAMSASMISARSSSSTPDSASLTGLAPTSSTSGVSSSGMSTIFVNGVAQSIKTEFDEEDGSNSSATVVFNGAKQPPVNAAMWRQCRQRLAACQRRAQFLTDMTNRVLKGGRLSTADIMGGATSESEIEDTPEDDSLSTHNSEIASLQQRLESLHTTLLSTYSRRAHAGSGGDSCRVQ